MLRRKFLKGAALAGAGSVGVAASFPAPALAQSMPEIKWRLPTSFQKSLDTIYGGSEFIAKRVAEPTDKKFQTPAFACVAIVHPLQVLSDVPSCNVTDGLNAPNSISG